MNDVASNSRVENHLKVSRSHIKLREYFRLLRANPFKRLRTVQNWPTDISAQIVDANCTTKVLSEHDCSMAILMVR
jgi:hypothetical protein